MKNKYLIVRYMSRDERAIADFLAFWHQLVNHLNLQSSVQDEKLNILTEISYI